MEQLTLEQAIHKVRTTFEEATVEEVRIYGGIPAHACTPAQMKFREALCVMLEIAPREARYVCQRCVRLAGGGQYLHRVGESCPLDGATNEDRTGPAPTQR